MARILAIDYGLKRTGLAVTDPLQIIATALDVVDTKDLLAYLKAYMLKEPVERIVLGMPVNLDTTETDTTLPAQKFEAALRNSFPETPVSLVDERFTTKIALRAMIDGGTSKKYRREKGNIDKVSATIILQSYMEQKGNLF